MAGFKKVPLNILLSRSSATYNPGDKISGQVQMNVSRTQITKGILIKFTGQANIFIAKQVTRKVGRDQKEHKWTLSRIQDEQIFDMFYFLFGNQKGKERKIDPGMYKYPFEFQVPLHCPSSYSGSNGSVKYTISVENFSVHLSADESTCEMSVTIKGALDMNRIPSARKPTNIFVMEKIKRLYCCNAGAVGFKFDLRRTGFVTGDWIDFFVEIYNHSRNAEFRYINLSLQQICQCNAHDISDTTREQIAQADGRDFPCPSPGEHAEWKGSMRVPDCIPSNFGGHLEIINLSYVLHVCCRFDTEGETRYDPEGEIPIIIGTIGHGRSAKPKPILSKPATEPGVATNPSHSHRTEQEADPDSR